MTLETQKAEQRRKRAELAGKEKALLCRKIAEEKKGVEPLVLDLRRYSSITDFFVIVSGTSDRQVLTIADEIQRIFAERKLEIQGVEGIEAARWVLIDCDDVVVHIFQQREREFYDLEGLWNDAPRL